jgi:transposase
MAMRKIITTEVENQILELKKQGCTCKKIAEMFGVSISAINNVIYARRKAESTIAAAPRAKELTPREAILFLYSKGYRIRNGKLVVITEREVNIEDVIKEGK